MLLLKRGGETIFNGPLGFQSQSMISYFESIPGVPQMTQYLWAPHRGHLISRWLPVPALAPLAALAWVPWRGLTAS